MTVIISKNDNREEIAREIKAIRTTTKKIVKSRASARKYLIDNGFITKDLELTKLYSQK